jgi:hypothetical protein
MRIMLIPSVVALALLAGCDAQPGQVGPGAVDAQKARDREDVVGAQARARGPVAMPPSIAGMKSFRCADNTLAIVEFYSDGKSATVRTSESDPAVRVVAQEAGGVMKADGGWSVKGGPKDAKVTFSSPKHPKTMSCHV